MRKIILTILAICFSSSVVFAGTQLIQRSMVGEKFAVYEICTGGYKFVVVRSIDVRGIPGAGGIASGLSIVQVYDSNGKPIRC